MQNFHQQYLDMIWGGFVLAYHDLAAIDVVGQALAENGVEIPDSLGVQYMTHRYMFDESRTTLAQCLASDIRPDLTQQEMDAIIKGYTEIVDEWIASSPKFLRDLSVYLVCLVEYPEEYLASKLEEALKDKDMGLFANQLRTEKKVQIPQHIVEQAQMIKDKYNNHDVASIHAGNSTVH